MYYSFNEEYLMHHGILNQRWGFRRYQNSDGSLTSLGQKHREEREGRAARAEERKAERAAKREAASKAREEARAAKKQAKIEQKAAEKAAEERRAAMQAEVDRINAQRRKPVQMMTDSELAEMTTRLKNEQTYQNLLIAMTPKQAKTTKDLINDQLKVFGEKALNSLGDVAISYGKDWLDGYIDETFFDGKKAKSEKQTKMYEEAKKKSEYWQNVLNATKNKYDANHYESTKKREEAERVADRAAKKRIDDSKAESDYWLNMLNAKKNQYEASNWTGSDYAKKRKAEDMKTESEIATNTLKKAQAEKEFEWRSTNPGGWEAKYGANGGELKLTDDQMKKLINQIANYQQNNP